MIKKIITTLIILIPFVGYSQLNVVSTVSLDENGDGYVDAIEIQFNQGVNDGSIDAGAGVLDDWELSSDNFLSNEAVINFSTTTTVVSGGTDSDPNDEYVKLSITTTPGNVVGTGVIRYRYTNGNPGVTDIVDQAVGTDVLANIASTAATDGAAPVAISSEYLDTNADGQVDRVDVTFSEDISTSSFENGDWSFPLNPETLTVFSGAISGSEAQITVNGAPADDTSLGTSTVQYTDNPTAGSITDGSNASGTGSAVTIDDGAAPVAISAEYLDTNADGQVDRVDVTFSEDISTSSFENGDWSFPLNPETLTVFSGAISGSEAQITVNGAPADDTSLGASTVQYTDNPTAGSITDGTNPSGTGSAVTIDDGAAPVAISAEYLDTNSDGQVDRVDVTFSEDISTSSFENGDWSFPLNPETLTVFSGAISGSEAQITVNGAPADDTSLGASTVQYTDNPTAGSITDGSNASGTGSAVTIDDGAAPVAISAEYLDTNADGQVDRVDVTFSEDISTSSFENGDWSFPLNPETLTVFSGAISGSEAQITVNGAPADDTSLGASTVQYTDNPTAGSITDGTNPSGTGSAITIDDGAAPVLVSSVPSDDASGVAISANVVLTFSEDISSGSGDISLIDFNNGGADDRVITIPDAQLTFSTNTLTINPSSDLLNITDYAVNIDATAIDDAVGNSYLGISNNTTLNFTTVGSTPTFSATWLDDNSDGDIDQLRLDFSATSSFSDGNGAGQVFDAISITGGISITNTIDFSTVNNVDFYIFDISGATGTADPGVTITYNQGNQNTITADAGGQEIANASNPTTETDGAAPVAISAEYLDTNADGQVDRVDVTFSEDISTSSFENGDWSFPLNPETLTVFSGAISGSEAQITVNGAPVDDTSLGASTVQYTNNPTAGSITDGTNPSSTGSAVTIDDGAAPVAISAEYLDTNTDGQVDRVDVTFSEDISTSTFENGDWSFPLNPETLTVFSGAISGSDAQITVNGAPADATLLGTSTVQYTNNPTAGSITDGTNPSGTGSAVTIDDGAAPIVLDLEIFDAGNDGLIERIDITFSEDIDTDDGVAPGLADLGTLTLPDGIVVTTAPGISDPMGSSDVVSVTGLVDQATQNTGAGSTDIDDLTGLWEDGSGNAIVAAGDDSETITDSADPVLVNSIPAHTGTAGVATNIQLVFSETPVLGAGNVTVTDEDDGSSTQSMAIGTGVISGDTVTIDVTSDLDNATNYSVQVATTAVDDASGNSYAGITNNTSYTFTTVAVSSLSPGDIAFIGLDAEDSGNDDNFSIVVITELDGSGTPFDIRFTDNEWDGNSEFNSGEGEIIWTIDVLLSPGTVVDFNAINTGSPSVTVGAGSIVRTGNFNPSFNGDALFAYDGTGLTGVSLIIAGISNSADWGSLANSGLTLGTTAVEFAAVDDNFDAGEYTGIRSGLGAFADYLTRINDPTEWTTTDDGTTNLVAPFDGTAFTIDTAPPNVNSITPSPLVISDSDVGAGNFTIDVEFDEATDGTTDPIVTLVPDLVGAGTLSFDGGAWSMSTFPNDTYTATYTVVDLDETQPDVAISINGASDSLGNVQTTPVIELNEFDVDTENPTFVAAHFFDTDADGNIDEIVIEMSEEVDASSAEEDDFILAGGLITGVVLSGGASNSLDASDTDEYVTLTATLTGTGTANIGYNSAGGVASTLADANGNDASDLGSITETDAAAPVITAASTVDTDLNGWIDGMTITLSENLNDGASTFDGTTFTVTGYAGESASTGGANDNTVNLTFTETGTGSGDTDATPDVTLNSGTLSDGTNSISSDQLFTSTADGAAPAIVTMEIEDTDSDGLIDRLTITWSENVDTSDGNPPSVGDGDFGTIDLPDGQNVSAATVTDPGGISATVTLSAIGDQISQITSPNASAIDGITNQWTDGINLTADPDENETIIDSADPVFTAAPDDNGGDNYYRSGETITFNIALSESVSGTVDMTNFNSGFSNAEAMTPAMGSALTYTTIDVASADESTSITVPFTVTDGSGNMATNSTLIVGVDNTDPTVAVDNLTTAVASPELTGTIADNFFVNNADIDVQIGGDGPHTATNNADGTWTLSAGTLAALTSGTYDVVLTATDSAGNTSNDATTDELTVDVDAPTFDTQTATVDDADVTITVNLDETGTVYYVIIADGGPVPTGTQVAAGDDGSDTPAPFSGSISVSSDTDDFIEIVTLAAQTDYDLYLAAEDDLGNLEAVATLFNLTTGGVVITAPTLGAVCLESTASTLGNIVITESINNDFATGATQTLRLGLPTDFEFNTAVSPTLSEAGNDISGLGSSYISNNVIEITYNVGGETTQDNITIANLQILSVNSTQTGLTITRVGGNGDIFLASESDGRVFGTLTSQALPPTPTIQMGGTTVTDTLIQVGSGISLDVVGSGGTYTWYYNNQSSVAFGPTALTTATQADLNGGTFPNSFNNSANGLYTLYLSENDGACNSDFAKVNVLVYFARSSRGTTSFFDNDTEGDTVYITEPNLHEVSFSGSGVGTIADLADSARARFVPIAAGVGSHPMDITTENTSTGETVTFQRTYTVSSGGSIFSVNPGDRFCNNGSTVSLLPQTTDLVAPEVFHSFTSSGGGLSGTNQNTTDWEFDPTGLGTVVTSITITRRKINTVTFAITDAGSVTFEIYPEPTVEVSVEGLDSIYCVSEAPVSVNSLVNGGTTLVTTYDIQRQGLPATLQTIVGNQFDPADPLGDASSPVGTYEIFYTSLASDDPNVPASPGCVNSDTVTITVAADPSKPAVVDYDGTATTATYYEFCSSETIGDITVAGAAGSTFRVYSDENLTTEIADNTTGVITASNLGLSNLSLVVNGSDPDTVRTYYVTQTTDAGCVSDTLQFAIGVYFEEGNAPQLTNAGIPGLQGGVHELAYCVGETIPDFTLDDTNLKPAASPAVSYFTWYPDDGTGNPDTGSPITIADADGSLAEPAELGMSSAAAGTVNVWFSQTNYDRGTNIGPGLYTFNGCESALRQLTVTVYEVPAAPAAGDTENDFYTEYYACEGDNTVTGNGTDQQNRLITPQGSDTVYVWYADADGSGSTVGTEIQESPSINLSVLSGLGTNELDLNTPGIYYFWVSRVTNRDNSISFDGCESTATRISVTVYPDATAPDVTNEQGTNPPYFAYNFCEGELEETTTFEVDAPFTAATDNATEFREFNWYQSNSAGTITNPTKIDVTSSTDGSSITASELAIVGSGEQTRYFLVTHNENIRFDGNFNGCESAGAIVQINIRDVPDDPDVVGGTNDFEYCNGDVIADIELTGEGLAGEVFNWYADEDKDSLVFTGSTASATDLGITNDITGLVDDSVYVYYVTQTQDINYDGITFAGCEGSIEQITVTIHPIPDEPTVADKDALDICVDETLPTLSITNRFPGAGITWFDSTLTEVSTSFDYQPDASYNTPGFYTFYVSQTTDESGSFDGCTSPLDTVTFQVNAIPGAPEVQGNTGSNNEFQFCEEDDVSAVTLDVINPDTTSTYIWYNDVNLTEELATGLSVSFEEIDFGSDQIDIEFASTHIIYVVETASGGCAGPSTEVLIVVDPLPILSFTDLATQYCADEGTISIGGENNFTSFDIPANASFTISTGGLTDNGNGTATFDLASAHLAAGGSLVGGTTTSHDITLSYNDANGCQSSITETISIDPDPDITFIGEVEGDEVFGAGDNTYETCVSAENIELIGIIATDSSFLSGGLFSGPGVVPGEGGQEFDPSVARNNNLFGPSSTYTITYEYTDPESFCTNSVSKDITVHPIPEFTNVGTVSDPEFIDVDKSCSADEIIVSVSFENVNVSDVSIQWWSGATVGTLLEVTGETSDSYTDDISDLSDGDQWVYQAIVTNNATGCQSSDFRIVTVQPQPDPKFSWEQITAGAPTNFDIRDNANLGNYSSVSFDIGGTSLYSGTDLPTGIIQNTFTIAGTYVATLTLESTFGCTVQVQRTVNIVPRVTVDQNGLIEDFDQTTDWFTNSVSVNNREEDLDVTDWDLANPTGSVMGASPQGGRAWITNNGQDYEDDEPRGYFVYSPTYDISALSRPTVSFYSFTNTDARDGAVLQFSVDGGVTWDNIGSIDIIDGALTADGIEWFDSELINGLNKPGVNNPEFEGWSGEETDWVRSINLLPGIADPTNLRFRFMFGSNGDGLGADGFAFDDFRIFESSRVSVIETFSSLFDNFSQSYNTTTDQVVNNDLNDVVWINYFGDFDNSANRLDPLNERDRTAPGTMSTFYGINDAPFSVINGVRGNQPNASAGDNTTLLGWSTNSVNLDGLEQPQFDLTIVDQSSQSFEVDLAITATSNFGTNESKDLTVRVFIVEKFIDSGDLSGAGTDAFQVVRKMLPNPDGFNYVGPLAVDQVVADYAVSWEISDVFDPGELAAVAYVQDETTKEIYQGAIIDLTGKTAVPTAVEQQFLSGEDFAIYPNPANESLAIQLQRPAQNRYQYELLDQTGKVILSGGFEVGQKEILLDTEGLPGAIYFINVFNDDLRMKPRRVIVTHR